MIGTISDSRATESPVALLFHGSDFQLNGIEAALDAERIQRRSVDQLLSGGVIDQPAVLLVTADVATRFASRIRHLPQHVVAVAVGDAAEQSIGPYAHFVLSGAENNTAVLRTLRTAYQLASARFMASRAELELSRSRDELRELHRIGMALMTERDPDNLLYEILKQAKRLTRSDAGSLYLTEKDDEGNPLLRFKLTENESLPDLPFSEFTLPITPNSIAGYSAYTSEPVRLDDTYEIPADAPYKFNRAFDERFGYRTKSMLVIPMLDHKDEVVGVLQLINRKNNPLATITSEAAADEFVEPYSEHELQLVQSLAGQAAISIENSQLYAQIEQLFESFVKAAVTAIDQRDPTTAGHSIRVATLTTDIASAVERAGSGPYRDVRFTREQMRELRYAAMLHDFGKVGVREEVLVKSKKLPPYLWERVEARFDLIRRTAEAEYHKRRAELLLAGQDAQARELADQYREQLAQLDHFHEAVRGANEPSVLPEAAAGVLVDIAKLTFERPDGRQIPYLAPDELHFLQIPKGSLDEKERVEIESHVEQTYRFLTQIPWTEDLQNLAKIAYGHHEKLNGTGYPRKIKADEIPVQTRMMTIADIFDALTASDRPYKRALPTEKALSIIEHESKEGLLDSDLVKIVIEGQVYKRVLEEDWRQL